MHIGSWNTTPPPQKKAKKYLEFQKNHDVFPIEGLY